MSAFFAVLYIYQETSTKCKYYSSITFSLPTTISFRLPKSIALILSYPLIDEVLKHVGF